MQDLEVAENKKTSKLIIGLILDAIGMLTSAITIFGDFADVIWAPIAAIIMARMYKGRVGKVAGVLTFIEEILPVTDLIPSFTLTWIYTYYFMRQPNEFDKK